MTGIYTAQLAVQSGLKVVAVASSQNKSYLSSLGVTAVVDRNQAEDEIVEQVVSAVRGQNGVIRYVLDCVGSITATVCARIVRQSRLGPRNQGVHEVQEPAQFIGLAGNPSVQPKPSEMQVHRISFSTTVRDPNHLLANS